MLKISNLTVGYKDKVVFENINLELSPGFTAVLGQNGSGKTTLFRAISGIIPIKQGCVSLNGENLLSLSPKQRASRISQIFGNHLTLSGITGTELVEMAFYHKSGLVFSMSERDRETVTQTAKRLDATAILQRRIDNISAGERQLLELVSALCQDTPVLLLDEPTSALDFNRTHDFLSIIKSTGQEKIIFAALHDPSLALEYADRIILIKDGVIAGDVMPNTDNVEQLQKALSKLYPNIKIIKTDNNLSVINQKI